MYGKYECCGYKDHHPSITSQPLPVWTSLQPHGTGSEGRDPSSISKVTSIPVNEASMSQHCSHQFTYMLYFHSHYCPVRWQNPKIKGMC